MVSRPVRLIAAFVVIVAVALVGSVALSLGGAGGALDGENVKGQSPEQFQPENVNQEFDPESGEIDIDSEADDKRILVDTRHGNQLSESKLEPVTEAMFGAGYTIEFDDGGESQSRSGNGGAGYRETLQNYDGLLVVQPTQEFSGSEIEAIRDYTDAGGRVVVLAEPTQVQGGAGLFGVPSAVSFGADNLTQKYGVQIGSEMLYNIADAENDNNFKSIYASPDEDGTLTEGVERVNFDMAGYAVVRNTRVVDVLYTAVDGTSSLDTRRTDSYPVVARNDNLVFVADSTFIERANVYDVDNEAFVGNLMEFLVSGDLDPGFGPDRESTEPRAPPTAPETPTPPEPSNATSG
ncbi:MAG: DUF4350 domain-containing protein [Haloarculaceae archaeon]